MQLFLFPLQNLKRAALQQVVALRMAFRARKVLGTFEKRAPDLEATNWGSTKFYVVEKKRLRDTKPLARTFWRCSHECEASHPTGVFCREEMILHELFGAASVVISMYVRLVCLC